MTIQTRTVYEFESAGALHSHDYIVPRLEEIVAGRQWPKGAPALDFGCGNGVLTGWLKSKGFSPAGFDLSKSGVAIARATHPDIPFSNDISAESIAAAGPYELATCIEVIGHCCEPDVELRKIFDALAPGGTLILATPYYGYFKNLVLAVTGRLDRHLTSLDADGYVRFFSMTSIAQLLGAVGFEKIDVARIGRFAPLAKVMIVTARKPAA